ncbi:RICIN domain-containing protein [Salinispora fenicalii]|uniref:RICIN domain-containing protein n=1 Tax=Salinispora fenicalii TaxID=1137263 RepID=UPI000487CC0A|nr:RICIN domain-containing protein [Salinispora fenicalii]
MSASAQRPDPAGTVYRRPGPTRPRPPRDPLMWGAALIGAAGLLLGGFFVLGGPGGAGTPTVPAVAATPSTEASTPSAQEPPAPPTVAASSPTSAPPTEKASSPPAIPTGPTVFRQVASGRCLGVDGDGARASAKLLDCHSNDPRQRWLPTSIGPGLVSLVNQASNMCLDVEGANGNDGARLQQHPCHGEANQQWQLVPTAGGQVLIAALHSGRCAYPDGGRPDAGTEVRQITCVDVPDQQWQFG